MSDNYDALKERGFSDLDIENLQVGELMNCIDKWVTATRTPPRDSASTKARTKRTAS
jgi:hypothetical protein